MKKPFVVLAEMKKKDIGAQVEQVDEHQSGAAIFVFEIETYPEAKSLVGTELRALYRRFRSWSHVAELIGASEAFARQNSKKS